MKTTTLVRFLGLGFRFQGLGFRSWAPGVTCWRACWGLSQQTETAILVRV